MKFINIKYFILISIISFSYLNILKSNTLNNINKKDIKQISKRNRKSNRIKRLNPIKSTKDIIIGIGNLGISIGMIRGLYMLYEDRKNDNYVENFNSYDNLNELLTGIGVYSFLFGTSFISGANYIRKGLK